MVRVRFSVKFRNLHNYFSGQMTLRTSGQGQSGQAVKLFQTPRKVSLPSISDIALSLSSLMM